MRAVVLEENATLIEREVPAPEAGAGMVRIRVAVCGICGSDIPRVFANGARRYPLILGHEFSGVVDALGEGVRDLAAGDPVTAAPLLPCGSCAACRRGDYALCEQYGFLGSRQDGAMAEYVAVPAQNVLRLPQALPFVQAATIEPATVALHGLRRAGGVQGKSVAVIGCGMVGLYALQWAKLLGANRVMAIGRGEQGLCAARSLGANVCCRSDDGAAQACGWDCVIECVGAPETIRLAWRMVDKKGTVCLVGTPKQEVSFSPSEWEQINRKECRVTGSWMSYTAPFPGREWRETIQRMEEGALRLVPGMVRAVYPMERAEEAFAAARHGGGRCMIRVGEWNGSENAKVPVSL